MVPDTGHYRSQTEAASCLKRRIHLSSTEPRHLPVRCAKKCVANSSLEEIRLLFTPPTPASTKSSRWVRSHRSIRKIFGLRFKSPWSSAFGGAAWRRNEFVGQTVGAGLVIDCSTHLHKILSVDLERKQVHVEPGVVLAQLNKHLKTFGYQFGPDVSTIDRACLGGMIANNSAGSRSIKYGMTDHVAELNVLLSDGSAHRLQRLSLNDFERQLIGNSRIAEAYRAMDWVRKNLAPDIAARFPKILRRVSGYSLDR